jgi:hypothetical protein
MCSFIAVLWVSLVSFAAITLRLLLECLLLFISLSTQSGNFWIHPRLSSDSNCVPIMNMLVILIFFLYRLDCFRKTYRAEGYFGMYRGECSYKVWENVSQLTKLVWHVVGFCASVISLELKFLMMFRTYSGKCEYWTQEQECYILQTLCVSLTSSVCESLIHDTAQIGLPHSNVHVSQHKTHINITTLCTVTLPPAGTFWFTSYFHFR